MNDARRNKYTGEFAVEASGLTKHYGEVVALDGLDLAVPTGSVLGLLGPNGAGKTTSFYMIVGLVKPNSGHILINSINVNELPIYIRTRKFKIGYVPQYGGYFHDLTLIE